METAAEVRVLGTTRLLVDARAVHLSPKERRLVATLALHKPEAVSADRLIVAIWGESAPPTVRKALQTYVASVRKALGPGIETTASGYRLSADVKIDTEWFESEADAARRVLSTRPGSAVAHARRALALMSGVPLADLVDSPEADASRSRLVERISEVGEVCAEAVLRSGDHTSAVSLMEEGVVAEPYREHRWWLLMLALYRSARRAESLRAYERARKVLAEGAGLDVGDRLHDLEAMVLADDSALLDDAIFPSGSMALALVGAQDDLPSYDTSFLGRDADVDAVLGLLAGDCAVGSIVGVAGVGKSRLAVEAARRVAAEYEGGTWWVSLSRLPPGADVAPLVFKTLGISPQVGENHAGALADWLASRRALLILDTCEHVLDSARALLADVDSATLGRVLVTSRRRLGLGLGLESVCHLRPLRVAPLEGVSVAGDLFLERMGAAEGATPDQMAAVTAICSRLDGVPLAIELAASRARSVPIGELVQRVHSLDRVLRDTAATTRRHSSLHEALQWSIDLLSPETRRVLDRMSVFQGGATLDTVLALCSDEFDQWTVVDALDELVEASLLDLDPFDESGRYRMLDTVKAHAAKRLSDSGEAGESLSHLADHMVALAGEAMVGVRSPDEAHWVGVISAELANIRTAHDHLLAVGDLDRQVRLVAPLINFGIVQAFDEILAMARRTAEAAGTVPVPGLARIGTMAAWLALRALDHDATARFLALARTSAGEDPAADAEALQVAAVAAYFSGDFVAGKAFNDAGAATARAGGDAHGEAMNLGLVVQMQGLNGNPRGWHEIADHVLALSESVGSPSMLAWGYYTWGLSRQPDDAALALAWFERSIREADSVRALFYGDLTRRSLGQLLEGLDTASALRVGVRTLASQLDAGEQFQLGISLPWFVTLLARLHLYEAALVFDEATYTLGNRVAHAYNAEGRRKARTTCAEHLAAEHVEMARLRGRTITAPGLLAYAESLLASLDATS